MGECKEMLKTLDQYKKDDDIMDHDIIDNMIITPDDVRIIYHGPGSMRDDKLKNKSFLSWLDSSGSYLIDMIHKVKFWFNSPVVDIWFKYVNDAILADIKAHTMDNVSSVEMISNQSGDQYIKVSTWL